MDHTDTPLDRERIRRLGLEPLLDALADELCGAEPVGGFAREGLANDLFEIRFSDGRSLVIKRARVPQAEGGFRAARAASRVLRRETDVLAPAHLELPPDAAPQPTLAYWRIPRPTLQQLWPVLTESARLEAWRSWGELAARIHRVRFAGHGPLAERPGPVDSLETFLRREIRQRLAPTFASEWHAGVGPAERLLAAVPAVARRLDRGGGTLIHNDLHMPNVLCEVEAGHVRCVGVLDLEAAFAGPAEADLARPLVLYGPRFGDFPRRFPDAFLEGHGPPADPAGLDFFRAFHLLDIGLHCARRGLFDFAAGLAEATSDAAGRLVGKAA